MTRTGKIGRLLMLLGGISVVASFGFTTVKSGTGYPGSSARIIPHTATVATVPVTSTSGTPSTPSVPTIQPALPASPTAGAQLSGKTWTVMAVGGSVARGWDATTLNGYLPQAMDEVSSQLGVNIRFFNESIGGFTAERMAPLFPKLLAAYRPDIVIISWGTLDDIANHTSEADFEQAITNETNEAVQTGAMVWVVTPPATPASYAVKDDPLEESYAGYEMQAALESGLSHVHVFDLLNLMKFWLAANHQSISSYADNGWHPNTAGHLLAGQLLGNAIIQHSPQDWFAAPSLPGIATPQFP